MRKRLGLMILIVALVTVFLYRLWENDTEPASDQSSDVATGDLQDGNYLVKMPVSDHGNYPMAKMEVKDGEIVSFEYVEILATSGEEKNEDNYNYPEGFRSNQKP